MQRLYCRDVALELFRRNCSARNLGISLRREVGERRGLSHINAQRAARAHVGESNFQPLRGLIDCSVSICARAMSCFSS